MRNLGSVSAHDAKPKPAPRRLRRACACLLGILIAGLSAEVYFRTLPAEALGFVLENGVFLRPPEFTPDPQRNALGFHDVEFETEEPNVPRVLLLGDSYVAALSVALADTVGRRLEDELRPHASPPPRVLAAGLPGWGQTEQLTTLQTLGPALKPTLVLSLLLPFNDIRDNSPTLRARANAELAALARSRPGWLRLKAEDAPALLIAGSRLNQWFSFHLAQRKEQSSRADTLPLDYEVYAVPPSEEWTDAWQRTEALLLQTAELSRALGARYALAIASTPHGMLGPELGLEQLRASYPALRERSFDLQAPTHRLQAFCKQHGIPCLDLETLCAEEYARHNVPLHWPRDGHWNRAGNAYAAQLLASFVRELLQSNAPH